MDEAGHQPIGEILPSGFFEGADLHHLGIHLEKLILVGNGGHLAPPIGDRLSVFAVLIRQNGSGRQLDDLRRAASTVRTAYCGPFDPFEIGIIEEIGGGRVIRTAATDTRHIATLKSDTGCPIVRNQSQFPIAFVGEENDG
ncbi:MAG: hypothetical protein R2839_05385 [Thermomicrobiales bacterium]